jgi:hypothetical protein
MSFPFYRPDGLPPKPSDLRPIAKDTAQTRSPVAHVLGALSRRLALADEIERSEPKSIFSWPKVLRTRSMLMLYFGLGKEGLNVAAKTSEQPNTLNHLRG